MTFEEADKIYKRWIEFVEINDKLGRVFHSIPKSLLPYPLEVLEEALNIIAENFWKDGEKRTSKNIQETIGTIIRYKYDEEALNNIPRWVTFSLKDPELKKIYLANLKKIQEFWQNINKTKTDQTE